MDCALKLIKKTPMILRNLSKHFLHLSALQKSQYRWWSRIGYSYTITKDRGHQLQCSPHWLCWVQCQQTCGCMSFHRCNGKVRVENPGFWWTVPMPGPLLRLRSTFWALWGAQPWGSSHGRAPQEEPSREGAISQALCQLTFVWETSLYCTSNLDDSQGRALFLVFLFLAVLGEWKGFHSQLYMIVYSIIF